MWQIQFELPWIFRIDLNGKKKASNVGIITAVLLLTVPHVQHIF